MSRHNAPPVYSPAPGTLGRTLSRRYGDRQSTGHNSGGTCDRSLLANERSGSVGSAAAVDTVGNISLIGPLSRRTAGCLRSLNRQQCHFALPPTGTCEMRAFAFGDVERGLAVFG